MGSSNTENYNNNDFFSYKRMTGHIYILHQSYYMNQTPKGTSNMQRIAQLLRRIRKLESH